MSLCFSKPFNIRIVPVKVKFPGLIQNALTISSWTLGFVMILGQRQQKILTNRSSKGICWKNYWVACRIVGEARETGSENGHERRETRQPKPYPNHASDPCWWHLCLHHWPLEATACYGLSATLPGSTPGTLPLSPQTGCGCLHTRMHALPQSQLGLSKSQICLLLGWTCVCALSFVVRVLGKQASGFSKFYRQK